MEVTTRQYGEIFGIDQAAVRAQIRNGALPARIASGQGARGLVYKVTVPDGVAVPETVPGAVPAGFIGLRQAERFSGIRYTRLIANCYHHVYPSAVKVQVGKQWRWYVSRADLGLAERVLPAPATIGGVLEKQFIELARQLFEAGKDEGFEQCRTTLLASLTGKGPTNGKG